MIQTAYQKDGVKMNMDQQINIHGKITILEMNLTNLNDKLEVSCRIFLDNIITRIVFNNVSGLRIENFSPPLEVQGFEIINHSQDGYASDSRYEICDYENESINFFCENITLLE